MANALQAPESLGLVVSQSIDQNPAAVYLSSLAKGSRRTMQEALSTIAAMLVKEADAFTLNWSALRFQHTNAVRSKLAERYSAATANKMLSALRGVLCAAFSLGQMNAEDYLRAKTIKPVKGNSMPSGRALSSKEIESLLQSCTDSPRDGALLSLLYSCGLRRAEVCNLDFADFDESSGALTIRKGKGNKTRTAYVKNGAAKWLADWLKVRGDSSGPLFVPILKGGKVIADQKMTPQAIWFILEKRALQAKVKDVSPHDFRRTFISDLLDNGADVSTVQKLAGHANVQTTLRYDRRGEDAKIEAVKGLKVPYFRT